MAETHRADRPRPAAGGILRAPPPSLLSWLSGVVVVTAAGVVVVVVTAAGGVVVVAGMVAAAAVTVFFSFLKNTLSCATSTGTRQRRPPRHFPGFLLFLPWVSFGIRQRLCCVLDKWHTANDAFAGV